MEIFTDGAAIPNPGRSGAGIFSKTHNISRYLGFQYATNNQMELVACIEGFIDFIELGIFSGKIKSDSMYVVKGINEWMCGWKKKRWHKVKNKELWMILDYFHTKYPEISVEWVKGHNGLKGNECADELANAGVYSMKQYCFDTYLLEA